MAAPKSVYKDTALTIHNPANAVTEQILLAQQLTSYGSEENIKGLFHLDIVLPRGEDNAFLGGVKSDSDNAEYHNLDTRRSKARVAYQGNTYEILNDSGLNTKPDCEFVNIEGLTSQKPVLLWAGFPQSKVGVKFISAMYSNTTIRDINIYDENDELIDTNSLQSILQGKETETIEIVDTKSLTEGERVKVELVTTNEEGTIKKYYENGVVGAEVSLPYLWNYYNADADGVFIYNRPDDIKHLYIFSAQAELLPSVSEDAASATGIHLYTDTRMNEAISIMPNTPPNGWYSTSGNRYYYVLNGEVQKAMEKEVIVTKPTIVPVIINGNIGIEVTNAPVSGTVFVTSILYYDSVNATQSVGNPQVFSREISNLAVGSVIDTKIPINKQGDYARFSLSDTNNYDNPIVMLMDMNFNTQI